MRFVQKVRNGFDHCFTFVITPGDEPTNNRAERGLKEPVVQRKVIGTFRKRKGTRIYETIVTLLAIWKQLGVQPVKEDVGKPDRRMVEKLNTHRLLDFSQI